MSGDRRGDDERGDLDKENQLYIRKFDLISFTVELSNLCHVTHPKNVSKLINLIVKLINEQSFKYRMKKGLSRFFFL